MSRRLYSDGQLVSVRDPELRRWRRARVLSVKSGRLVVATTTWWGVVPTRREHVRPIAVVRGAA